MFTYTNVLGRAYDTIKKFHGVTFNISRYGTHQITLDFEDLKTEEEVVQVVERYLSETLTPEYFKQIISEFSLGGYGACEIRGDCLGEIVSLEAIEDEEGMAILYSGN